MITRILSTAVLLVAAISARAQAPVQRPTQAQIDAAIDNGTKFLVANYRERLERGKLSAEERVGQTALSLYTLLKCGVPQDDVIVHELLLELLLQPIDQTYDVTCALLALGAHDVIDDRRWIEELARKLAAWQSKDGDWGYAEHGADLSNTQYAALGLWTAAKAGVEIEPRVWERLASAVLEYQAKDGGFGYTSDGRGSTGSMTAAGVAVLAICEIELRRDGSWTDKLAAGVSKARARGIEWLTTNFSVTTNPRGGAWLFYYLYGLERMGALAGVRQLGEHDWYDEGSAYLLQLQRANGAWQNGTDLSETCFALLFLRRATLAQERRGPVTGEAPPARENDAPLRLESKGRGPVRVWIAAWNKELVRGLEWPHDRGRGARVSRVEYLEGERVLAVELGDASRACGDARFAFEHMFSEFGVHRVRARAFVDTPSGEQVLESAELELEPERAWPAWVQELSLDLGANRIDADRAKVHASSVAKAKSAPLERSFDAALAIDGRASTPWLADPQDNEPTLTISLVKTVDADLLRISPAMLAPLGVDFLSRVVELELEINGKHTRRVALDPDPRRPVTLEFDKPLGVKRIDVRILAVARGTRSPLVGLGEIELYLRK